MVGGLVLVGDFNLPGIQWVGGLGTGEKMRLMRPKPSNEITSFKSDKFIYSKGDFQGMCGFMRGIKWDRILNLGDLQECYNQFLEVYWEGVKRFIPQQRENRCRHEPWMNREVMELRRRKKRLWYRWKASRLSDNAMKKEYRSICRRLKSRMKAAVARHELELANDKKNPKRLFY